MFVPSRARLEGQLGLDAKRSTFWVLMGLPLHSHSAMFTLERNSRSCQLHFGHENFVSLVCSMYWRICSVSCPEKNASTVMKTECSCTTLEPKILRQRENQATPTSACGSRSHGLCFSLFMPHVSEASGWWPFQAALIYFISVQMYLSC